MAGLVADRGGDCCLMHMLGEPRTMQDDPRYDDVVAEVKAFLEERAGVRRRARASPRSASGSTRASASARRSSTTSSCCARLDEIVALGRPVVDRHLAQVLPRRASPAARRRTTASPGTIATNVLALERGASRLPRPRRRAGRATPSRWRLLRSAGAMDAERRRPDDDDELDDDGRRGRGPRPDRRHDRGHRPVALHRTTASRAAEREVGQRLVLDLRLEVGECDATVTDRVEDTVDYGEVCQTVALVAQQRSVQDARAPVHRDRRPPARRLRRRDGVGQGGQARAADPAAGRRGLRRGLRREPATS